jgi:hypothetical protein
MARRGDITSLSYPEFKERVPRLDQRARIAWKLIDVTYQNGLSNLRDLIVPKDQPDTEDRMAYVARRASERQNAVGPIVEGYILDKGFGTETARAIIRNRQEHPEQTQPEEHSWIP